MSGGNLDSLIASTILLRIYTSTRLFSYINYALNMIRLSHHAHLPQALWLRLLYLNNRHRRAAYGEILNKTLTHTYADGATVYARLAEFVPIVVTRARQMPQDPYGCRQNACRMQIELMQPGRPIGALS